MSGGKNENLYIQRELNQQGRRNFQGYFKNLLRKVKSIPRGVNKNPLVQLHHSAVAWPIIAASNKIRGVSTLRERSNTNVWSAEVHHTIQALRTALLSATGQITFLSKLLCALLSFAEYVLRVARIVRWTALWWTCTTEFLSTLDALVHGICSFGHSR